MMMMMIGRSVPTYQVSTMCSVCVVCAVRVLGHQRAPTIVIREVWRIGVYTVYYTVYRHI